MANDLKLREIPLHSIPHLNSEPTPRIRTDEDVDHWKSSRSYQDYGIFLRRLNESVKGHFFPWTSSPSKAITQTITLLDTLDHWIDIIPPLETPQRFGNLAFRKWGKKLEESADEILTSLLTPEYAALIPLVKPYLLTSFGSFSRMDYGTGHECSFALFLLCLTLVQFYKPVEEEERELVLTVFHRYLRLVWRLQDVYRLEPAGSHGVWGLDDYCFLPYIFGSGQLRDQNSIPVSAVIHTPLPPTNFYFMAIMRIYDVKHGPFFEHSSQLHSIAVGVPNWGKVNSGLFKMYEAEVLGKRVVVQHIPLGGLLDWDVNDESQETLSMPPPSTFPTAGAATPAPWASLPRTMAFAQKPQVVGSPRSSVPPHTAVSSSTTQLELPTYQGGSTATRMDHKPS